MYSKELQRVSSSEIRTEKIRREIGEELTGYLDGLMA
jgi:hypothetical protein